MLRSDEEMNQEGGMMDSSSSTIPLGNAPQEAQSSDNIPYMKQLRSSWWVQRNLSTVYLSAMIYNLLCAFLFCFDRIHDKWRFGLGFFHISHMTTRIHINHFLSWPFLSITQVILCIVIFSHTFGVIFSADQIVDPAAFTRDNYVLGSLRRNRCYLCFLALFMTALHVTMRIRHETTSLTQELVLIAFVVNLSNLRYLELVKLIAGWIRWKFWNLNIKL